VEVEEQAKGVGPEQGPVYVERRLLAPGTPPHARGGPVRVRGTELASVDADER
jgi:hypothetical protein